MALILPFRKLPTTCQTTPCMKWMLSNTSDNVHRGPPLTLPEETLHSFLFQYMEKHGNKTCIIDNSNETSYSFREVMLMSQQISIGLKHIGICQDDKILFYKNNSAELITMLLGVSAAGAVSCLVNPASTAYELQEVYLADIRPKYIFTDAGLLPTIQQACNAIDLKSEFITDKDGPISTETLLSIGREHPLPPDSTKHMDASKSPAIILFSSGTSGLPKGVVLSHTNMVASLLNMETFFPPDQTAILNAFPICHVGGLLGSAFRSPLKGFAQIMYPRFDFHRFLEGIQRYKVNSLFLPPPLLVLMAKSPLVDTYDLRCVQSVHTAGAPIKQDVEDEFKKRMNNPHLVQIYGLTEMPNVLAKTYNEGFVKPGSVGKPTPGTEVKILHTDTGELLGPNKQGELLARGSTSMLGYFNKPQHTATILDNDGWIHTGDLAYYDDDGYFYIVDRIKELIKYKSFQVSPAELEDVLLRHPSIADVAVFGILNKEAGELPCAHVVKQNGSSITEKDIHAYLAGRVAYFKQLRGGVIFVDSIPKLANGKILRRVLRKNHKL